MANPFDQFDSGIGRPVIRKGPEPTKPSLPQGYTTEANPVPATTVPGLPSAITTPESYRPITDQERKGFGLDPSKPFMVNIKTGKPELIGQGKDEATPAPEADAEEAAHTTDILDQINRVREMAKNPMTLGNLPAHGYFQSIPIIGQNAADMAAGLNQVYGDLTQKGIERLRLLNGGESASSIARNKAEQKALADSAAAISQTQSTGAFIPNLNEAERLYRRQLGRFYDKGLIDDATAKKYGITHIEGPTPPVGGTVSSAPGEHITESNQLPTVTVAPQMAVSGTEQAVLDPNIAKIAPQLEQYLNADPKKVSNAMIVGFMQKNGVDPAKWPDLINNISKRGKGVRFEVDPYYNKPLSDQGIIPGTSFLSEQARAFPASTRVGAALAGVGDTATFGLVPDLAAGVSAATGGNFLDSRKALKDKQNLLAYEHPGATVAGNLLGGLSTLALSAPETFGRMVAQAGVQGGVYGAASSDDPSPSGRFSNAVSSAATDAAAAATLNPALKLAGYAAGKAGRGILSAVGTSADDLANSEALRSFATHAPQQDIPAMQARAAAQTAQGVEPSGLTALDRAGQDYTGRQVARSPGARTAADEAVSSAQAALPGQIEQDFHQAIDDAAGGDKYVASFLKRPAREITADVQDMAGREYEAGIAPIKNERLNIDPALNEALSHEQVSAAIGDVLRNHTISTETRAVLRSLPQWLKEGVDLSKFPVTVDAVKNIATALDRRAAKLQTGSGGGMTLGDLSDQIRSSIGEQFPEYQPVNALYASRKRAIGALNDARSNFLGDGTGNATDTLANKTARMSDEPGAPEYTRRNATPEPDPTKFTVSRPNQAMPSETQMAIAGAKEATTAAAKASQDSAASTAERLSTVGQQERNRMILGDRAAALEASARAKATNVRTMERVQSGGTGDDTGGKVGATIKAVANLGFHRAGAAAASALSGMRGMSPDDAARVTKILMTPGKTEDVMSALESAYGSRKARFIMVRIGALATTANKRRQLPAEAVTGAQ